MHVRATRVIAIAAKIATAGRESPLLTQNILVSSCSNPATATNKMKADPELVQWLRRHDLNEDAIQRVSAD